MHHKLLQTAKLDQRLVMSQQLTQAITLLQYSTMELKQFIQQQLETSVILEAEEVQEEEQETSEENTEESDNETQNPEEEYYSAALGRKQTRHSQDMNALANVSEKKSLQQNLVQQSQLCHFSPEDQVLAEAVIQAIDDDGYLTMATAELAGILEIDTPPSLERLNQIIRVIQTMDPPGIGARNLQECLLLQLNQQTGPAEALSMAKLIIEQHFDCLAKKDFKKLAKILQLNEHQIHEVLKLIQNLNPKPGQSYTQDSNVNIEPEIIVRKINGRWQAKLADSLLTGLKINDYYYELITRSKKDKAFASLSQELLEAQWLLKGLAHRNETLLNAANYILAHQYDFFDLGPSALKPLNLMEVAKVLKVHESTISRISNGKYLSCPRGLFELKYFFPGGLRTQTGTSCSDAAVKEALLDLIKAEPKGQAYSDDDLAGLLKQKGIKIARRTIAKYRTLLNILPSYQRNKPDFEAS